MLGQMQNHPLLTSMLLEFAESAEKLGRQLNDDQ